MMAAPKSHLQLSTIVLYSSYDDLLVTLFSVTFERRNCNKEVVMQIKKPDFLLIKCRLHQPWPAGLQWCYRSSKCYSTPSSSGVTSSKEDSLPLLLCCTLRTGWKNRTQSSNKTYKLSQNLLKLNNSLQFDSVLIIRDFCNIQISFLNYSVV